MNNTTYQKSIRQLQLEREMTAGKICQCASHTHVLANTITCLRKEVKQPYKINHYKK